MNARDLFRILSGAARTLLAIGALMWIVALLAVVSMVRGNPTAINGVVGAGAGAVAMTAAGVGLARQDLRFHRAHEEDSRRERA